MRQFVIDLKPGKICIQARIMEWRRTLEASAGLLAMGLQVARSAGWRRAVARRNSGWNMIGRGRFVLNIRQAAGSSWRSLSELKTGGGR